MNTMPCGLEDDRVRFEPDEEDADPRTDVEKRLSWICDEWAGVLNNDHYDDWHDLRMMIYGASQALIHCRDRFEDYSALRELGNFAFECGMAKLRGEA